MYGAKVRANRARPCAALYVESRRRGSDGGQRMNSPRELRALAPVEPTEIVREADGSFTELHDIPHRPGRLQFRRDKVLRLAQMQACKPGELGSLLSLCKDLFIDHWHEIRFGICIQGAVYELQLSARPEPFSMLDGYLTVGLETSTAHFHLCLEETRGLGRSRTPEEWARQRPCRRAAFYRTLRSDGCTPGSWGIRLWNGAGEQMLTVFLPSPFLTREQKRVRSPDWSQLALWNELRRRYLDEECPQPVPQSLEARATHS